MDQGGFNDRLIGSGSWHNSHEIQEFEKVTDAGTIV
jgi:hypothetical protein